MRTFVARYPFAVFATLTLLFQFAVVAYIHKVLPADLHIHDDPHAHNVFRLRLFGPLTFAVLISFYLEGRTGLVRLFGGYLHWRAGAGWYALAVTWKFLLAWIGMGLACLVTDAVWPGFFAEGFLIPWIMNIPGITFIALVEETSWMRFSITRLQEKYSAFTSAMIVGNLWGLWYLPMLLIEEGVPPGYPVLVFHGCMLSLTVLLTWVYNSTRSGTVLLLMQILSNTVFFMVPVLPGGIILADGTVETRFVVGFSWAFIATAVVLVLVYGTRNLSRRAKVKWSDPL